MKSIENCCSQERLDSVPQLRLDRGRCIFPLKQPSKEVMEEVITVKRLSIDDAKLLIEGAEQKSREIGVPMCIAVADESGNLVAFLRMEGAKVSSIDIAINKAFTCAAARKGTHEYNKLAVPGKPTFGIHVTNQGRFSIICGGLPLVGDEDVVGGIGISAGTAGEDQIVAQGAIDSSLDKITAAS